MKAILVVTLFFASSAFAESFIDKEEVRQVFRKNLRSFKACYETELKKSPDLAGKVVLEFTIGGEGKVIAAKVKSSTLGNAAAEDCFVAVGQSLQFPKPPAGKTAVISYPFIFAKHSRKI